MNVIFLTIILILIIYYFFKCKKRFVTAAKLQGPRNYPIVGYPKMFTLGMDELLPHLCEIQKKFQKYYKLWIGPELWLVVYDPKLVERILTDQHLSKSNDYLFLRPWLGKGLLTNEGKEWFSKRRAITPAFHFNILTDFIGIFEKHVDIFIEKINSKKIINIAPELLLLTLETICEAAMGIDMKTQENSTPYVDAIVNLTRILYRRMFSAFLQFDFIFRFTKDYKIFNDSLQIVQNITDYVIKEKRMLLNVDNQNIQPSEINKNKKMALLDILLKTNVNGVALTDTEIRDEVNTFLFAGHDTTASTIGFLLHNLAKYQEVQNKVYQEIKTEFFEQDKISLNSLNNLSYLDAVIKESMRMHTTIPFIGRQIVKQTKIDELIIPENTNISIYIYGMCHDDEIFENPYEFKPERFENLSEDFNPFSFIPFSAGHRNCLGQRFAILEMKTVLVKILQKYEIILGYPNEELVLEAGMILKAQNGINLKFVHK